MNTENLSPETEAALEAAKLAKVTEWWAAKDALQTGQGLTEADFDIVLNALPQVIKDHLAPHVNWTNLAFELATAFNSVKHLLGQGSEDAKKKEMALRREVVALYFPTPKEGSTNKAAIENGWGLKYTHKIDRSVVQETIDATRERMQKEFPTINLDTLLTTSYDLNVKNYKEMKIISPDAMKVLEESLLIKVGSPTLELVPPKADKAAGVDAYPKGQENL